MRKVIAAQGFLPENHPKEAGRYLQTRNHTDIHLFTSQLKAVFYDTLFYHLALSEFEQQKKRLGRTGYSVSAMICAFVVMKCEGFDITKKLPSYWTYDRFFIDTIAQKAAVQIRIYLQTNCE